MSAGLLRDEKIMRRESWVSWLGCAVLAQKPSDSSDEEFYLLFILYCLLI